MVNLVKTNSVAGIYIAADDGGKILGNTPGDLDLDNLTPGSEYVYFAKVDSFDERITANRDANDLGYLVAYITDGKASHLTGGGVVHLVELRVTCSETIMGYMKRLLKTYNKVANRGLNPYLFKQVAAESFRPFHNAAGVPKKYCPVIIRGLQVSEHSGGGKDLQHLTIALQVVWAS